MTHDVDSQLNTLVNNLLMLPEKDEDYTYEDAIKLTRFALVINPNASLLHFNLACFYSATEKIEDSLRHLEAALQQGYSDWEKVLQDPSLERTRRTVRYREIVYRYLNDKIGRNVQ